MEIVFDDCEMRMDFGIMLLNIYSLEYMTKGLCRLALDIVVMTV